MAKNINRKTAGALKEISKTTAAVQAKAVKAVKKSPKLTLQFRFTMLVMADILSVFVVFWGASAIIRRVFHYTVDISLFVWLLFLSVSIGALITYFIGNDFLKPINKLNSAMKRVAKGDFSVRLNEKSSFRDVQDINANFNLMTSELGATEVLQSDFVSNVSHEFKTPIGAIEGYATLLQGSSDVSQEQLEYIDKILANTRRLSKLVGNILLLSKVDNQVIRSSNAKFSLSEQIRQSIIALEPEWSAKNIEFDVDMEEIDYNGQEGLLMHVWDNLIGNAVKFDPENGCVGIRLARDGRGIVFSVADSGPGIQEDAMRHIFDRFYQADESHKELGNGLGLALVSQILKLCGGTVEVSNRDGGGCVFTVTLPEN